MSKPLTFTVDLLRYKEYNSLRNQPGIQATVAIHVSDSCGLNVLHTHCVAPPG